MRSGTRRLHLHTARTAISSPPSLRVAVIPLLLRAATVAPAGILPAHLPVACWHSVLPATSARSPPPRHEALSCWWEQREQERRGLLGPLCLVPWQAPPLRNAIELFRGMKRLSAQPLGSPVPFNPALTVLLAGPIYTALPGLYPPLPQSHFRHPLALRLLSAGQSARVLKQAASRKGAGERRGESEAEGRGKENRQQRGNWGKASSSLYQCWCCLPEREGGEERCQGRFPEPFAGDRMGNAVSLIIEQHQAPSEVFQEKCCHRNKTAVQIVRGRPTAMVAGAWAERRQEPLAGGEERCRAGGYLVLHPPLSNFQ